MPYLNKHPENLLEALLSNHLRYLPIVEFLDNVIQNTAELSWSDCEIIGIEIGKQNKSEFCVGVRRGMIEALPTDTTDHNKLRPILAYVQKLNQDSSQVIESDIQAIRDLGWSDQTVEDVVGLVAILKVFSTLANGLGFKALPHEAFTEMGVATVQLNGYLPIFHSFIEKMKTAR